jgi:hypothetical protein
MADQEIPGSQSSSTSTRQLYAIEVEDGQIIDPALLSAMERYKNQENPLQQDEYSSPVLQLGAQGERAHENRLPALQDCPPPPPRPPMHPCCLEPPPRTTSNRCRDIRSPDIQVGELVGNSSNIRLEEHVLICTACKSHFKVLKSTILYKCPRCSNLGPASSVR